LNAFSCLNSCLAFFSFLAFFAAMIVAFPAIGCACSDSCVASAFSYIQQSRDWARNVTGNETMLAGEYQPQFGRLGRGVQSRSPPFVPEGWKPMPGAAVYDEDPSDPDFAVTREWFQTDGAPAEDASTEEVGMPRHSLMHKFMHRAFGGHGHWHRFGEGGQHGESGYPEVVGVEDSNAEVARPSRRHHPMGGVRDAIAFLFDELSRSDEMLADEAVMHALPFEEAQQLPEAAVFGSDAVAMDADPADPSINNVGVPLPAELDPVLADPKGEKEIAKPVLRRMMAVRRLLSSDDQDEEDESLEHRFQGDRYSSKQYNEDDEDNAWRRKYDMDQYDDDDDDDEPDDIGQAVLVAYARWVDSLTLPEFQHTAAKVCRKGPGITVAVMLYIVLAFLLHASASSVARKLANHPWFVQQDILRRMHVQTALPPAAQLPSNGDGSYDANVLYRFVPGHGFVAMPGTSGAPQVQPSNGSPPAHHDFVDNVTSAINSAFRNGRQALSSAIGGRRTYSYAPVTSAEDPASNVEMPGRATAVAVPTMHPSAYATPANYVPQMNPLIATSSNMGAAPQMFGPVAPQAPAGVAYTYADLSRRS
jgi:hypothetical protein